MRPPIPRGVMPGVEVRPRGGPIRVGVPAPWRPGVQRCRVVVQAGPMRLVAPWCRLEVRAGPLPLVAQGRCRGAVVRALREEWPLTGAARREMGAA